MRYFLPGHHCRLIDSKGMKVEDILSDCHILQMCIGLTGLLLLRLRQMSVFRLLKSKSRFLKALKINILRQMPVSNQIPR